MDALEQLGLAERMRIARQAEAHEAQVALPPLLSGDATWCALKFAVDELRRLAPDDHDVFIQVGDIAVLEARFVEPHTFLFKGINQDGHRTSIVTHFSQLHARIVYHPKRGPVRRVIGFSQDPSA
jgi:hypothetical protein